MKREDIEDILRSANNVLNYHNQQVEVIEISDDSRSRYLP
jgi:hypothetical protein